MSNVGLGFLAQKVRRLAHLVLQVHIAQLVLHHAHLVLRVHIVELAHLYAQLVQMEPIVHLAHYRARLATKVLAPQRCRHLRQVAQQQLVYLDTNL